MFSNGFSVSHEIFVQAQLLFSILIKGFNRPAQQISRNDPFGFPVQGIGYQNDIGIGQFAIFVADHQAHFSQGRNTHGEAESPVSFLIEERETKLIRRTVLSTITCSAGT
jgi:hypothetical protein